MADGLLQHLPELAAMVIAIATDEPAAHAQAAKLPAGFQMALLEKIIEQTAAIEGGMGKVIEIVVGALEGTTSVMNRMKDLPR